MKTLKEYELPRIDVRRFSSENIVTDSGIIASLTDKGFTSENTVRLDLKDIIEMKK